MTQRSLVSLTVDELCYSRFIYAETDLTYIKYKLCVMFEEVFICYHILFVYLSCGNTVVVHRIADSFMLCFQDVGLGHVDAAARDSEGKGMCDSRCVPDIPLRILRS